MCSAFALFISHSYASLAAWALNGFIRNWLKRPVTITDLSAAVTGVLLAFNLPASIPMWMPVAGSFFAIVIVKQLFGGIGRNVLNPALAARVFMFSLAFGYEPFYRAG